MIKFPHSYVCVSLGKCSESDLYAQKRTNRYFIHTLFVLVGGGVTYWPVRTIYIGSTIELNRNNTICHLMILKLESRHTLFHSNSKFWCVCVCVFWCHSACNTACTIVYSLFPDVMEKLIPTFQLFFQISLALSTFDGWKQLDLIMVLLSKLALSKRNNSRLTILLTTGIQEQ